MRWIRGTPVRVHSKGMRQALLAVLVLGCSTFSTDPNAPGGSGSSGGVPVTRNLRVTVDWPTKGVLDPLADPRAAEIHLVVSDAADPTKRGEQTFDKTNRGPFDVTGFTSGDRVDVVVEILAAGSKRLVGYAEARRSDVTRTTEIAVAARKRVLYVINADRGPEQISVIDLAPPDHAELGMELLTGANDIADVPNAQDLVLTADARLLAVAGSTTSTDGDLTLYSTSTDDVTKTIPIGMWASRLVTLDGHEVLAFPRAEAKSDSFVRVNLDTGKTTPIGSGLMGGTVDVWSAIIAPDGKRVVAAGSYSTSSVQAKAFLFVHDIDAGTTTAVEVPGNDAATGARFTPDGKKLVVVAFSCENGGTCSGTLFLDDGTSTSVEGTAPLGDPGKAKPIGVVVSPDGRRAFVSTDPIYQMTDSCCGDFYTVNIPDARVAATFPPIAPSLEYQIGSALLLPYGNPRRAIAGMTDPGNDLHGAIVELVDSDRPAEITERDLPAFGTVRAMATPFGSPL